MYAMDAVKLAASNNDMALRQIGITLGKSAQYVTSTVTQGSTPKADTLSRMLGVCGYSLCAVPDSLVTDEMIVID